ncbi:MAG TPA: glycosyl hydrolase [Phycisphaerales bacterium]|nr:glycosyl hydrolase [Phycisphaerales bacterium]
MKELCSMLFSTLIRTPTGYLVISTFLILCNVAYATNHIYTDPNASVELRVEDLLGRLTLDEKAGFMSGKNMWFMKSVEKLGIPSVQVTDCGHGVTVILDETGQYSGCATCFPTAVAQAASWDRKLVYEIGSAIAREARDLGSAILLAPMVNIHRTPLNGRNYETYSEDPFLAGSLASSFIKGVQSEHIGAVIKAMTANNQQTNQQNLNVEVSERALREIYLPAFKIPVLDANPWGVMTAYNGLNGHPTSASKHLISTILKEEWRYDGFVVSDWRSVQGSESITAGLDIEMPGPGRFMATKDILNAVAQGILTEDELNDRVSRYLRALVKSKLLDRDHPKLAAESNTAKHRELARKAAEASIILLKNRSGVLPLNRSKLSKLAVIGPNAQEARLGGGGSASVTACSAVSPLKGLKDYCNKAVSIKFIEGVTMKGDFPIVGNQYLITIDQGKSVSGLKGEYFDNGGLVGKPSCVRIDEKVDFSWGWAAPCKEVGKSSYSVRWTGNVRAPYTGTYRIGVTCHEGGFRLYLNGKTAIDQWENLPDETFEAVFSRKSKNVKIYMKGGTTCDIRLEFRKWGNKNAIRLEWEVPGRHSPIEDAVRLAAESEAAIVFAGLSNLFEGGMNDREDLSLPEGQDELIRAVAGANANTVIVLINGTPITMPWLSEVAAVMEAYYPGQEGGNAIARVVFGDVNPSGKLPETFPRSLEDNPSHGFFPGRKRRVSYGEGIYVGYRHYDTRGIEPLFPFGHGLSYTEFEYSNLRIEQNGDGSARITLNVKNAGKSAGAETVQLYVRDIEASVDRPNKELKAFAKIALLPDQTKQVELYLNRDAFAFFSPIQKRWIIEPGEFELLIGSSSRDIRLIEKIAVE